MPRDWRRPLVKRLKKWASGRFPILFPVKVAMKPPEQMENMLGYFLFDETAVIALSSRQDKESLIDSFLEEWAHARCHYLVDTEDDDDDPHHHPSFWAEYGRLQQAARGIAW